MRGHIERSGSGRWLSLAFVVVLLCAVAAGPAVVAGDDETNVEDDADRIHIDIRVTEDGDAEWRVSYRVDLESDADREAFNDLAEDIESDPSAYTDTYEDRMASAAASAEAATDREMAIEEMTVRTETEEFPESTGIVIYEFTWTNFAAVDGNSIQIGDAIQGMFLDEDTTLLISWPDDYAIDSVSPEPTDERTDAAVWRGPFELSTDEPNITVSPDNQSIWATITPGFLLASGLLIVLLAVGIAMIYRENSTVSVPSTDDSGETTIDPALMSNEEQVITVLENYGGRMKQKEVAEELDWTAAKTSQVTTDLREEGRIEGFRLGRENVLKLPDEDD